MIVTLVCPHIDRDYDSYLMEEHNMVFNSISGHKHTDFSIVTCLSIFILVQFSKKSVGMWNQTIPLTKAGCIEKINRIEHKYTAYGLKE